MSCNVLQCPRVVCARVEVLALLALAHKAVEIVAAVLVFGIPLRAVRKGGPFPVLLNFCPVKLVLLPSPLIA